MGDEKSVEPPHVILEKYGLLHVNCQSIVLKLIADKEAAEERASGLEQIVVRAQAQPIAVQSAGVRVHRDKKVLKFYAVYNVKAPQNRDTNNTVLVRITENTD